MLPSRRHTYDVPSTSPRQPLTFDDLMVRGSTVTTPPRPPTLLSQRRSRLRSERKLSLRSLPIGSFASTTASASATKRNCDNFQFFLKFITGTFWAKPSSVVATLVNETIKNANARQFLLGKNGLECLNAYENVCVHKLSHRHGMDSRVHLSGGARAFVRRFLENQGADYYNWLYFGLNCPEMYSVFGDYTWESFLGMGSFARVHLLQHRTNKSYTVVKLQKFEDSVEKANINIHDALKEVKVLQASKNAHIIEMKSHGINQNRVYIELEYADLGTLQFMLTGQPMTNSMMLSCWNDILDGLNFLHQHNIIHRDVKCENIFVFSSGTKVLFKLGDLNLARVLLSKSDYAQSYCGSFTTMAPEVLANEPYGVSADMWSFLCVALRTMGLKSVNPISLTTSTLVQRIPAAYDSYLKEFIEMLHKIQPQERPTAAACLEWLENTHD